MVILVSNEVKEYENKYSYIFEGRKGKEHLMPVLKEIQTGEGYLPQEALIAVSNKLEVALAHVYGVVTFYNFFKLEKQGKFMLAICEGTACHINGAGSIAEGIKEKLGINPGEITADGKFSVETVRCVGLCAFAPVLLVNGKEYTKLNKESTMKILEEYMNKND